MGFGCPERWSLLKMMKYTELSNITDTGLLPIYGIKNAKIESTSQISGLSLFHSLCNFLWAFRKNQSIFPSEDCECAFHKCPWSRLDTVTWPSNENERPAWRVLQWQRAEQIQFSLPYHLANFVISKWLNNFMYSLCSVSLITYY